MKSNDEICKFTKKPYNCGRCEGAKRKPFKNGSMNHVSQGVSGPLMNWDKKQWEKATYYMTRTGGGKYTADELKAEFIAMAQKGWSCFPLGECSNFCFKNGCMGHRINKKTWEK